MVGFGFLMIWNVCAHSSPPIQVGRKSDESRKKQFANVWSIVCLCIYAFFISVQLIGKHMLRFSFVFSICRTKEKQEYIRQHEMIQWNFPFFSIIEWFVRLSFFLSLSKSHQQMNGSSNDGIVFAFQFSHVKTVTANAKAHESLYGSCLDYINLILIEQN